ncbi:MAG TPA: serine/threonine-protein kinase [Pyrinomonadaceae bacterium]|nr:serine/threonine-protein kinase [Pyrinomonadaceae bacterium]
MNAERWKKIKNILENALETAPELRSIYLNEVCGNDEDLRNEVEKLLEFEQTDEDILEQNPVSAVFQNENSAKSQIGRQIGNYKIIGELGAGGMGAVFLAERIDGEFTQKAALKLIKRGMDSDAVLRRFFNERQILASLEHPNIAHLIDGGTTDDGLPFFVMEYVEGATILEYSDAENLDLEARLKLFREVCSAVSFAHQNLVIHRDLKPSNILVTKDGKVKLLDFGIAKLLKSEEANQTATQMHVFTPEYASPEQVRGENLTTASDVYSLGVILYELLTGNRPYKTENSNISEIIKSICETEPVRPSLFVSRPLKIDKNPTSHDKEQRTKDKELKTNPKSLKGDLDNIILKSLRKEAERRYGSVEQFSEDIRRHLVGLPVTASRDTWSYRASKFLQRNKIAATAAFLILISLLGGIAATAYQARIAKRERERAEHRFNDVRRLANSFMFEINEQIVKSPIKARELLVQRAVEYLDSLASEAGNDIALQSELATAYEKIGDVQAEIFKPNLGKTSDALLSHQKALQLREKIYAAEPNSAHGLDVAKSHALIGDLLMMSGQIAETRENYLKTIQILDSLLASDPANFAVRRKIASSYAVLGQAILRSGSLNEALANYEKSLEIFQKLRAENPQDSSLERSIGIVFSFIAFVKMETDQKEKAVEFYGKWLETEKKLSSADQNDLASRGHLATANTWYGIALNEIGSSREAISYLNEGLNIQEEIYKSDTANFGERTALADSNLELGKVLLKNNLTDEAIKKLEQAILHYEAVWQTDRENLWNRRRIPVSQRFLADAFLQKKDLKKASEIYRQSFAVTKELTDAHSNYSEWQLDLAMIYQQLGKFYLITNDRSAALKNFEQSLPIFQRLSAESPENANRKRDLEAVKSEIAKLSN